MELIIGGAYQGKRNYAKETYQLQDQEIVSGETCDLNTVGQAKALSEVHCLVRRLLEEGIEPIPYFQKQFPQGSQSILIGNEMGCGLVPIEAFDRRYRESVGRVLCDLAKRAATVTRVYCGLPQLIK